MQVVRKIFFFISIFYCGILISQQQKIQHYSSINGLANNAIHHIIQDKVGYLWLITENGYSKFDGLRFTNHKADTLNYLFKDKNTFYLGKKNGLEVIKGAQKNFYKSKSIHKIHKIQNRIILTTDEGISEFKDDYIQPLQINTTIDFSKINDLIFFENEYFIATSKGLWKVDKLMQPQKVEQILNNTTIGFVTLKNKLIILTSKNGIRVIANNKIISSLETFETISDGLVMNDQLWLSSKENGIEIYNANTLNFVRKITKYNAKIADNINTLFKDNLDNVWIGTNNSGLYKIATATTNKEKAPELAIENFTINYTTYPFQENLSLKANQNNIAFSFKTIDLNNPENITYQYSVNDKKSPWTTENNINFANLKSGKYKISIQSKVKSNLSKKRNFTIHIDKPLYLKTWFLLATFSCIAFIAAFIVHFRIQQIEKKNALKVEQLKRENYLITLEQKALQLQMNPHFVFNVLNGIKALGNTNKIAILNTTIGHFSTLLRNMLNSTRSEEIYLSEEIETLQSYLALEKLMSSKTFTYKIHKKLNEIDAEEILIPPMLIQPFVENSIKHGILTHKEDGKIDIIYEVKNQFLHCSIHDNGIGINTSKQHKQKSDGLSIAMNVTEERIKNLTKYNNFKIEDLKSKNGISGTSVHFKIPLKTDY